MTPEQPTPESVAYALTKQLCGLVESVVGGGDLDFDRAHKVILSAIQARDDYWKAQICEFPSEEEIIAEAHKKDPNNPEHTFWEWETFRSACAWYKDKLQAQTNRASIEDEE